jgi:ABC-type uncharacterized transport system ATPase subunit
MRTLLAAAQCKRTNIGIALITNPRVLFMDEPTSGLDSYTCNEARRCCCAAPACPDPATICYDSRCCPPNPA